ncbi:MAG: hypothetical protein IPM79_35375 [Polyangiaceae bacterium]|nr:hypothetical protein [Polyangiaceae bacterium]
MKNLLKTASALLSLSSLLSLAAVGCVVIPSGDGDLEITDDPDAACVAACEERNAADCGLQYDCEVMCEQRTEMDCNDEGDAYDACAAESADICNVEGCDAEANEAVQCFIDYCEAHPGEGACPSE